MHRVIWWVAALDFVNALIQSHRLAGWPGSHVRINERVQDRSLLKREGGQLVDQAALLSLEARPGVMGDKTGQPFLAMGPEEPGAVDWMESEQIQRWGVPNVVEERRRYQHFTVVGREDRRHTARLASDRLNMHPAVTKGSDQPFGLRLRPRFQRHGVTIPWSLDPAQAAAFLSVPMLLIRSSFAISRPLSYRQMSSIGTGLDRIVAI
jgi:hypothetical protein